MECIQHCPPVKLHRVIKVCKKHVATAKIIRINDVRVLRQFEGLVYIYKYNVANSTATKEIWTSDFI